MAPTLSSVTATADKWIDIPLSAFGTSYTDPDGLWDIPTGEYISSTVDGHLRIAYLPVKAGDVFDKIRIDYQALGLNDAINLRVVKRAAAAAGWTAIAYPAATFGSLVQAATQVTLTAPETAVEGTVYALELILNVATTGVKIFGAGVHTTSRSL